MHPRLTSQTLSLAFIAAGLFVFFAQQWIVTANAQSSGKVARVLEINGPIGPPLADYIEKEMREARTDNIDLIILEMDTPGGLDTSMRRIIKEILSSSIPVASYVSPSGARAASAGTYILYASHIAAMAPGTNLGAATPVQIGGSSPLPNLGDEDADKDEEEDETPTMSNQDSMRAKVINDASAYIKGLAEMRKRNQEWAVKAVRQAASLSATDAAEQNIVDFVAVNLSDLIGQSNGRTVKIEGEDYVVEVEGVTLERAEPDWATRILSAITDPNVAFLLMTIGFYGLFFELANPGSIMPGTFGLVALIMGLYALSVLPVSLAGAALLLLGIALMIGEAFAPSFGALGISGLAAFALGATMLFDTEAPGFTLDWQVIVATTIATGIFVATVIIFALGAQTKRVVTGRRHMMRQPGVIDSWDGNYGWMIVDGERWRATCDWVLEPGRSVKIVSIDGLTLKVKPIDK